MVKKLEKNNLEVWYQVLGMVRTNCYLLQDKATKDAVLIDPADNGTAIISMVKEAGAKLQGILLTHGHFDHIMAAKETADHFHVPLCASEAERELLADGHLNCSDTMGGKAIALEADEWLQGQKSLTFGSLSLQVIATPGHTRGGVCYYFEKEGILLSGDTLFLESVGRTDLPTGNSHELLQSVREKLMVLPEDTLVLPGHGGSTTIGYEKRNNPYMNDNFWEQL